MAKPPVIANVPPEDFAQVPPPRNLHPVADIRLVITDLAKLTERIDSLIEKVADLKADGRDTREKIVTVEKSIAGFEGSIKVFGRIYTLALVIVAALLAWLLRPAPQQPVAPALPPAPIAIPAQPGAAEPKLAPLR